MARASRSMALLASLAIVAGVVLAACTGAPDAGPAPDRWFRLSPTNEDVALLALSSGHDAVLLSGERAYMGGSGLPTPVLLASLDGRRWRRVTLSSTTLYGAHAQLMHMVTDGKTAAMVGQRAGGAHGIRRYTTWTGTLTSQTEAGQAFELFGGPRSLGVVALAGSGGDALAVGGWIGRRGAADVAGWRLNHGTWRRTGAEPALQSDPRLLKQATAVTERPGGYLVVGSVLDLSGADAVSRAAAWSLGSDGRWSQQPLPGSRALAVDCRPGGSDCVVLGVDDERLAAWRLTRAGAASVTIPPLPADQTTRAWVCLTGTGVALAGFRTGAGGGLLIGQHGRWRTTTGPDGQPAGVACTDGRLLALADGPSRDVWALDR